MADDCVFCRIVNGEIPSAKLYEDNTVMAFLDIMPVNKGHTLVIPKKHYELLTDIPVAEFEKLMRELHKLTTAVVKATKAEGFNIFMNNKKVAGQVIPHAHFHIVPRYDNDGIDIKWPSRKYEDGEIDKLKSKIKEHL